MTRPHATKPTVPPTGAAEPGRHRGSQQWRSSSNPPGWITRVRTSWPLLRLLTVREYRARYRQSLLDLGWSLISPLAILAVYGLIFSQAFDVDGEGAPYLSFVWAGLVVWTLYSSGLAMGSNALLSNADLLSKVYFPREVLPLAAVGAYVLDLMIALAVLAGLVAFQIGSVSVTVVAIVPSLAVALIWTAATAVFCAALSVFIRDTIQVVQLLLRLGILATPVMYGASVLPESLRFLAVLNPIAVSIEGVRDAVLFQTWPNWTALAIHGALGIVGLSLAIAYTASVERRMTDVI